MFLKLRTSNVRWNGAYHDLVALGVDGYFVCARRTTAASFPIDAGTVGLVAIILVVVVVFHFHALVARRDAAVIFLLYLFLFFFDSLSDLFFSSLHLFSL